MDCRNVVYVRFPFGRMKYANLIYGNLSEALLRIITSFYFSYSVEWDIDYCASTFKSYTNIAGQSDPFSDGINVTIEFCCTRSSMQRYG